MVLELVQCKAVALGQPRWFDEQGAAGGGVTIDQTGSGSEEGMGGGDFQDFSREELGQGVGPIVKAWGDEGEQVECGFHGNPDEGPRGTRGTVARAGDLGQEGAHGIAEVRAVAGVAREKSNMHVTARSRAGLFSCAGSVPPVFCVISDTVRF